MAEKKVNKPCPCCSGKEFDDCCKPYLEGRARPKTAKQLMRSRFTAYAIGNCGNYLFHTWHPDTRKGLTPATLSQRSTNWRSLEILFSTQKGDEGIVEFKAHAVNNAGKEETLHEISHFLRIKGQWVYVQPVKPQVNPA